METIKEKILELVASKGIENCDLYYELALEKFIEIRNYPNSYTDAQIVADIEKNKAKIAMAVIEIDSKEGVENQTADSENGHSRTYSSGILAYSGVVGFVNTY